MFAVVGNEDTRCTIWPIGVGHQSLFSSLIFGLFADEVDFHAIDYELLVLLVTTNHRTGTSLYLSRPLRCVWSVGLPALALRHFNKSYTEQGGHHLHTL